MLIVGPLHHSVGHQNDHVHVGGAVIPIAGAAPHSHASDERPSSLIADARRANSDSNAPVRNGDGEPSQPTEPVHGFDTLAHFGAAPLAAISPILTLLDIDVARSEPPPAQLESPYVRPTASASIRGPPNTSV